MHGWQRRARRLCGRALRQGRGVSRGSALATAREPCRLRGRAPADRRKLLQRRDVVHDPQRPAHRRDHEIVAMHLDVGDRRRRQVLLQRLPVAAVVERDEAPNSVPA